MHRLLHSMAKERYSRGQHSELKKEWATEMSHYALSCHMNKSNEVHVYSNVITYRSALYAESIE